MGRVWDVGRCSRQTRRSTGKRPGKAQERKELPPTQAQPGRQRGSGSRRGSQGCGHGPHVGLGAQLGDHEVEASVHGALRQLCALEACLFDRLFQAALKLG